MIRAIIFLTGLFISQIVHLQAQCPTTTYALCAGETYTLTAQSGLTNIQWEIDNGSGYTTILGANAPTYVVMGAGKYRYSAKDISNCDVTLCCPFEITVGTNCPTACPTTTYSVCASDSYTLTAQSGLTNIQWQINTGAGFADILGATSAGYIASAVGKYRYTAQDGNGCAIDLCCPFELVAGTNCPTACPTTTYSVCASDSYTLTAQSGLTNIQWQINTGAGFADILGATSAGYIASAVGKYRYTAQDGNGCAIDLCCPFELVAGTNCPTPCPTTTYPICMGESYTLTAQLGLTNVQWQINSGSGFTDIAGAVGNTFVASTVGKYRYTAKDATDCDIVLCCPFDLVVGTCPAPCPIAVYEMCAGESYKITAQAGLTNVQWQVDNGTGFTDIAGATGNFYDATASGKYKYTAKDANGCMIDMCCPFNIMVFNVPTPPTIASPQLNNCPEQTVNLTSLSNALPSNGLTYEWRVSNSITSNLVSTPSVATANTYYLFAKNANNCYSIATEVLVNMQICCPAQPICVPVTVLKIK